MQTTSSNDQQPKRAVGVHELQTQAEELVREISESGQPIDIVRNGQVAARLSPVLTTGPAEASTIEDREQAIREWLGKMDHVSREIAASWPKGVSAQDVIDDVRGPR